MDGDALSDCWEKGGIDQNNDGDSDYVLTNANPQVKDVYVEVDAMVDHQPSVVAMFEVEDAFRRSPRGGINLHIDYLDGDVVDHAFVVSFASQSSDFDRIKASNFGTHAERERVKDGTSPYLLKAKALAYRYALFAHQYSDSSPPSVLDLGSSGKSEVGGNDLIITLGSGGFGRTRTTATTHSDGSSENQAATFMHELGHALGLRHGGNDDNNCKPNYLSIMNYSFQFDWYAKGRPLTYSKAALINIEQPLFESQGLRDLSSGFVNTIYGPVINRLPGIGRLGGAAIDWNRNNVSPDRVPGSTIEVPVINADLRKLSDIMGDECSGSLPFVLTSHDDWANLQYNFRTSADFAQGVHSTVIREDTGRMSERTPDSDSDGNRNSQDNCPYVHNPDQTDSVGNGIGDACRKRPVGDVWGNDGIVTCEDLALVRGMLGTRRDGLGGWDPRPDVNADGVVDVRDVALVSQRLPVGTRCQ